MSRIRSLLDTGKDAAVGFVLALVFAVVIALVFQAVATWLGLSEGYGSAVLPTMAGVLAGVPFAVWLIRISEAEGRKQAQAASADELARERNAAQVRRHAILSVLDNELRRSLDEIRGARAGPPRALILPFLPTEAWSALSASGELRWIEDPNLIAKIANAYFRIGSTNEIERAAVAFFVDPVTQTVHWRDENATSGAELLATLASQDPHTIAAINDARAAIHVELNPGESP